MSPIRYASDSLVDKDRWLMGPKGLLPVPNKVLNGTSAQGLWWGLESSYWLGPQVMISGKQSATGTVQAHFLR